jgi:hypothetical protein
MQNRGGRMFLKDDGWVKEFDVGFGEDKKIEDGRDGYFWS